jgi:hypothetical protein
MLYSSLGVGGGKQLFGRRRRGGSVQILYGYWREGEEGRGYIISSVSASQDGKMPCSFVRNNEKESREEVQEGHDGNGGSEGRGRETEKRREKEQERP